jgi:hypothetical protein
LLRLDLPAVPEHIIAYNKNGMTKGIATMKKRLLNGLSVVIIAIAFLALPAAGRTQQSPPQEDNGIFVLGSILMSVLHVPFKLVTCVGTQATAAVYYTATFGVEGHYDGGTNGKDIGETARRSCTGSWFITPLQIKDDYGS